MVRSFEKILEKIRKAEKKLEPIPYNTLKIPEASRKKENALVKEDQEAIEEFKALKENINEDTRSNLSPAYQAVTVKNTEWKNF